MQPIPKKLTFAEANQASRYQEEFDRAESPEEVELQGEPAREK